ncbi:MAG: SDR family oxidoreductase [Nocardiopsaceae bacterium]|nr:SDR family oxidoreductase [Nocardiopsaceae bacterium]
MRTVLITGASGVVGRAVAAELRDCRVIGLVHSDPEVPGVDEVLRGDLSQDWLGLDPGVWRRLADEVDSIVHSGALTQWGQPYERYQAINVDGTRRVAELAEAAGAPVHMQSTCFLHVLELDRAGELGPANVVTPYVTSKLAAERVLASSGVPHSVFRSTNLVGDSVTGASSQPQIVQQMSDWLARGKAPYVPVHPGNLIDVAPLDVLAKATARVVEADDTGSPPYWVTYGPDGMTIERTLEIIGEHVRSQGRSFVPPPVIDPDQGLPVPLEKVPPRSRAFLKVLIDVSEVTRGCGGVLPTSLPLLAERFGVPAVSDTGAYRRSLDYWANERARALDTVEAL